jgi:hypothetical protein
MRAPIVRLALLCVLGCGPKALHLTMNPDNHSGQAGFAVLTDLGTAGMRVEVETSAPDVPAPQHAHIHEGSCGEIGTIIAGLTDLSALDRKPGRVGSTSSLTLRFSALEGAPHALNVHDSRDGTVYVSCGDIAAQ